MPDRVAEIDARINEINQQKRVNEIDTRIGQIKDQKDTNFNTLAQSFNEGLFDLASIPSQLFNLPISLAKNPAVQNAMSVIGLGGQTKAIAQVPQIDVENARKFYENNNFVKPRGEEATGFLNRGARIFGASVIPEGVVQSFGKQVLKAAIPSAQRSVFQQLTAQTAKVPAKSLALTATSSVGAGFGGEVAENLTDNPSLVLLGELAGGFTLPVITAVSRFAGKSVSDKIRKTIVPFTKGGAEPRAANRLQGLSADPEAEAALIDVNSPISPARQTGNPRLIALEKTVLAQNPELEAKFTDELNGALDLARQQATNFGGQNRVQQVLKNGQQFIINLVDLRAAKAAQIAQAKIAKIDNITPRETSRIAREELDSALSDTRIQESELWGNINKKTPGNFNNFKEKLTGIKDETGELVPLKIPGWLFRVAKTEKPVTFNDIQQVRSRVLGDARKASRKGDFDKARQLNDVADGLLDDMAAVNDPNVAPALAFSRKLNETFTEGAVGSLLSRGANRGAGVAAADTLNKLFSGTPATNVRAFLKASPESSDQLQNFIKSGFTKAATKQGKFSQTKAQAQIDKLDEQGMFEIFPELRSELDNVSALFNKSENLALRAQIVKERGGSRLLQENDKSLAGVLLGADNEVTALLSAENPTALAAILKRRMGGDKNAVQGLKSIFVESLFDNAARTGASGEVEIDGLRLAKLFNDNLSVAKALGMDGTEITRMRAISRQIIQAQQAPGGSVGAILDDKPAALLEFIARIAGAKFGQRVASGGLGSSLVAAGEGSKQARSILQKLTVSEAQKLVIAAQSDPVLYKALLTRSSAPDKEIFDATQIIESWIIGAGVVADNEQEP